MFVSLLKEERQTCFNNWVILSLFSHDFPMMLAALPVQSIVAALNHLLTREAWARARLVPYAGRSVCIITPFFHLDLTVQPDGLITPRPKTEENQRYDVSITLPFTALSAVLTQGKTALSRYVKIEGDAEFAATLGFLAQHLRWEMEEDLAQLIGDAPAYQLSRIFRAGQQQIRRTLSHLGETIAEYWLDENPTLVRHAALPEFATEVVQLRDAVARLEKRLERTQASMRRMEHLSDDLKPKTHRTDSTNVQQAEDGKAIDHAKQAPTANAPINR